MLDATMRNALRLSLVAASTFFSSCTPSEPTHLNHPTSRASTAAAPPSATPSTTATSAAETVTTVTADTALTTPYGATFTAPSGWTVVQRGNLTILRDPDSQVSLTFVERSETSGEDAIAAAWKIVIPTFDRKIAQTLTPPGRNGWDAGVVVQYETSEKEGKSIWAHARRKGDKWYVALFDGASAAWGKRRPGANIAFGSFKILGVEAESFKGKTANLLEAAHLSDLDAFIEDSRQKGKVPGISVAVVQGGHVVFERAYGVRELAKKDPVTKATLFRIASMTKPLTSLMIAALVDEGKFTWDTPVTNVYTKFALGDADLTKRLTIKNILCACTGIPYDNVGTDFEYASVSAENMLERMKFLKPTSGFGETFQYSNAMLSAAGFIAGHALYPTRKMEDAYERAMNDKVFIPLGMKSTTLSGAAAKRMEHALPHNRSETLETVSIPFDWGGSGPPRKPGGGVWSTAGDYAKYLLLELSGGKTPAGKQVVSEVNLLARRQPQARAGDKSSYGLALGVEDYLGVPVHGHSGAQGGYSSLMFFLPEQGVGVVILTNIAAPNPVPFAIRRKVFELLFDGRDEARADLEFALKAQRDEVLAKAKLIHFSPELTWIEKFVGTYQHDLYGKVTIRIDGKRGIFDAGEWQSQIGKKTEQDGTEHLSLITPPWTWIDLTPGENGSLVFRDGQRKVEFLPVKGK